MKKTNCFCCGTSLEIGEYHTDGLHGEITAHFGSKHDADTYSIAICDDCLDKNKSKAIYKGNFMGFK